MTMKRTSITSGQKDAFEQLVIAAAKHGIKLALEKVKADQDGWQKMLGSGDELRTAIAEIIVAKTRELSVSNQFADEEAESSYGYLSGYKPKGITEQTNILRELFPGIGFADEKLAEQPLPENAEGYFAIPNWEKNPKMFGKTYGEALQVILDKIKQTRNGSFYNYREGQLGPKYLRQSERTKKFFSELNEAQGNPDILIVPAQFGIRHRGRSVRRAREVFLANEFGLGAFASGIMLLTHPERLGDYNDLYIDCAGDEYAPDGDVEFVGAPVFHFDDGRVKFNAYGIVGAGSHYGSASGFFQQ